MNDFEKYVSVKGFYEKNSSEDFLIHLKQYHPGIPGYAVKYDYYITFKGEKLAHCDYKISADLSEVWINSEKIIVPDRVRQTGAVLNVTATYIKDEKYTTQLSIILKKWEQTIEDNFDTYNTELWTGVDWGAKVDMAYTYLRDNYVRDGKLCLDFMKHEKPTIRNGKECFYSDAGLHTQGKFSQTYGCFTAKMKVPSVQKGIFSAFWLLPEGEYTNDYFFKRTDMGDDFHGCGEIDIMEIFYDPDTRGVAHTEHFWEPNQVDQKTKSSLGSFHEIPGFKYGEYQEYSCVWDEYGIYYYVNGELTKANSNIEPVDDVKPAYILFTCYIAPKGSKAWWGEVEDKDLPQTLSVDWLRVYK
ncbi:MAG: glycoside hydrolase family 16 protein [Clostridia bacterium]|nr:glycoside hydrolase family 16 protein [Clostridia bacterium]